jgi:hypothetical protein
VLVWFTLPLVNTNFCRISSTLWLMIAWPLSLSKRLGAPPWIMVSSRVITNWLSCLILCPFVTLDEVPKNITAAVELLKIAGTSEYVR